MAEPPEADLLDTIAAAARLREGAEGVAALLRAVFRAEGLRLADAARAARLPLPVATAVRRELERAGVLERRQGLSFTRDGRLFAEERLGLAARHDPSCASCAGRGLVLEGPFARALDDLRRHLADPPEVDVTLDQAPCTAETAMLRAALMLRAGAVEGRRILVLGDDDSVSLALGLAARHLAGRALARQVTVVELDPNRRAFIQRVAAAEEIAVTVLAHDLREPLPPSLGRFDVFETDPPYTLEGAELFLTRAVEALDGGTGQGFFSFAQWPPRRTLALQRLFVDLGLAVTAVHPGFNAYQGAAVLGGAGQLLELAATGPPGAPSGAWDGPLYTAEVAPRERLYRCTACGRRWRLGADGVPDTIEALKRAGCPACGSRRFARA